MNAALVQSIRLRMRQQPTEQLLALWTTNDRVLWSPEAFEAVKAVLAERGHADLPKQNDPAPIASRFPRMSPEAQYWLGWLRPILWIAMAPAALRLTDAPGTFGGVAQLLTAPSTAAWTPADLVVPILSDLVVPAWLIVGGIVCLRIKPWGRTMLLLYPVPVLALAAWSQYERSSVYERFVESASFWSAVGMVRDSLETLARALLVPAILHVLLRRHEIRALFMPSATGFSVEPAPPAPDAPSGG